MLEAVVEQARDAQKEAWLKEVDDFADITWAATYGFQRSDEFQNWDKARHRFGRSAKLYENLIHQLLEDVISTAGPPTPAEQKVLDRAEDLGEPAALWALNQQRELEDVTFGELTAAIESGNLTGFDLAIYIEALKAEAAVYDARLERFSKVKPDTIAPLIANQPQLTLTASFRELDDLIGPDSEEFKLSYELGRRNFNRVLKVYHNSDKGSTEQEMRRARVRAFQKVVDDPRLFTQDKFTFSLAYRSRDAFKMDFPYQEMVTDPDTMTDVAVDRMASLDLDHSKEWCGKVLWTRYTRSKKPEGSMTMSSGKEPEDPQRLFALSVEWIDVQDDPLRQNRLVASLSYTLPIKTAGGAGVPLTLVYADRSEFLGDPDHQLSAHVGISFDINRKK